MKLETLYIRFYKSFNYDYLRKAAGGGTEDPWDSVPREMLGSAPDANTGSLIYPFVRIQMDPTITTVVGSNESGKSQLLKAVECLLTGEGIERRDFCRYSRFFAVHKDMAVPEFGGKFTHLDDSQIAAVRALAKLAESAPVDYFHLFRRNSGTSLHVPSDTGVKSIDVRKAEVGRLKLPTSFRVDADIPLPSSVPIDYLCETKRSKAKPIPRNRLMAWLANALAHQDAFASADSVTKQATKLAQEMKPATVEDSEAEKYEKQLELAKSLLVDVAGINPSAFEQLRDAVLGEEGYANGLVDQMNDRLASALNFPKWWSQDSEFALYLTLRDFDLVFTVRDRTHTDYSFEERSGGMAHFLGYFVKYLSHEPASKDEILLMDEPDAYLSTSGQHDLLKVFEAFASPTDGRNPVQVVYVTHSPFLIDKNHSERIRVLQKGENDEGTRVVKDASRNHYEPLRSAFGAFVAETTFIGNCNLLVEGATDQILLAGVSGESRKDAKREEHLDLNKLTMVPAGGTEHVPYMAYLARGRDLEKPAVVVLLDGDQAGQNAKRELLSLFKKRKPVDEKFIIVLNEGMGFDSAVAQPKLIEDLIDPVIASKAIGLYAMEVLPDDDAEHIATRVKVTLAEAETLMDSAKRAAKEASRDPDNPLRLDKVGFVRAVLAALADPELPAAARARTLSNFRILFRAINKAAAGAVRAESHRALKSQVQNRKDDFLKDFPNGATKRAVDNLLDELEELVENDFTREADITRLEIGKIRQQHHLQDEPGSPVHDWDRLREEINRLEYAPLQAVQDDEVHDTTCPSVDADAQPASSPPDQTEPTNADATAK